VSLERLACKWKDNINMDLKYGMRMEIGCISVDIGAIGEVS